ncbi:hypothetical protein Vretimale_19842 [Volvox reticuliferus]|uniref:Uncharacterized protein n=1 Tax=Volvox reticuliferus TaxID=1737510 RepID=A0A8J4CYT3_9CHLO|nr:hypothetical protein Vretifemale_19899 [Volvox reticuliferus]GIM17306.1 hypothetical protein Vretimale_19842 [Volvox reticuliferus]
MLTLSATAATSSGGGGCSVGTTWAGNVFDSDPMGFCAVKNVDIVIHCLIITMAALPESLFRGVCLSPDVAADATHLPVVAMQESGPLADWEAAVGAYFGSSIHACVS